MRFNDFYFLLSPFILFINLVKIQKNGKDEKQ